MSVDQLSVFDTRVDDLDTCETAAATNRHHRQRDRDICLAALYQAGTRGLTDFELESATTIKQTSCGKRRLELQRDGLVEKTEHRRLSPSGTPAVVWRITFDGRFRHERERSP